MRLAIISDIHGNDIALRAVLDDIIKSGVDLIVCLGDVATLGVSPEVCMEMLRELDCMFVMGNHDEFLLTPDLIKTYITQPVIVDSVSWCRDRLVKDHFALLRSFKQSIEINLDGAGALLCVHGSPRSHMDNVLSITPPDDLDALFEGHDAAFVACGHTHIQMLRQHRGRLFVNPGSVGCPIREYALGKVPVILHHAEYAVVEAVNGTVSAVMKRLPIDKTEMYRSVEASDIPLRGYLMHVYS